MKKNPKIKKLYLREWGATNTTFFLELGRRSPAGPGKLEMTHKVLQVMI